MKVRYLSTGEYQGSAMTPGVVYEVLGIEADYFRIINDLDDPCLYEPDQFIVVDGAEPAFWLTRHGDDGERYCYPLQWRGPGFFEDYHDGIASVRQQFWDDCERLYGIKNPLQPPTSP